MSDNNDNIETQPMDIDNLDIINSNNIEEFDKEQIYDLLTGTKFENSVCSGITNLKRDLEYQLWVMTDSDKSEEDKNKAFIKAIIAAKKIRCVNSYMDKFCLIDTKHWLDEFNNQWRKRKPLIKKKAKECPAFLKKPKKN